MKCWKKVKGRDEYIKKDGTRIVQQYALNGPHEGELGVSVDSKPDKSGIRTVKINKYFGKFQFGPKEFTEGQASQKKANKFIKKYMKENDRC